MPTKVVAQISVKCAQMPLVLDGLFFDQWCDIVHLKGQSKKKDTQKVSKGMTDVSAHGYEAETAEAKRIIEMERLMEEEGVECFLVMAADAPLGRRMGRAVRGLRFEV